MIEVHLAPVVYSHLVWLYMQILIDLNAVVNAHSLFTPSDLAQTDLLVLASPIYWFDVSAQTKCFIDRMYAFACKGFHVSAIAMLLNSGAAGVYGAAEAQLKAISSYLKWENKGTVEVPGMAEKGSMHDSEGLQRVLDFAKSL